jgi:hypothetical protein
MAFKLQDFNSDGCICPTDCYYMFNQLKENDHLLSDDVRKVLAKIYEKKDMNEMQSQLQEVNRRHA